MDKFIARENIRHFTNQLGFKSNPSARTVLQKLLLEPGERGDAADDPVSRGENES